VFAAFAIAALAVTATLASPQSHSSVRLAPFKIDAVHSSVLFRIRHNGVGNFWGRFNEVKGEYKIDPDALDASSLTVEIPVASVDTANKNRDDHLKGPDFFNAPEFPVATFKSTSFEKSDSNHFTVKGDLTLHGKTNPVSAKVEWIGMKDTGRQGFRSGMEAQFTFERSKWGIDYGIEQGGLGDEVMMIIAVEGVRQ
jgi:polyisoprenoid-binding protein YceI